MFPKVFFTASYFADVYFQPVDGDAPIVTENVHTIGMILNMGTMIGRQ